jgi:hypothetical protein
MGKTAVSKDGIRTMAYLAVKELVEQDPMPDPRDWRTISAIRDLRNLPWGSYGESFRLYNKAFDEALLLYI